MAGLNEPAPSDSLPDWGVPMGQGPLPPLATFDLMSDGPLPPLPAWKEGSAPAARQAAAPLPASTQGWGESLDASPGKTARGDADFWVEGDVIMCACPDCRSPMSVRMWLMIADCWHCGASIELSEEQEREVQRLLQERERKRAAHRAGQAPATPAAARAATGTPSPTPPKASAPTSSKASGKTAEPPARSREKAPPDRTASPTRQPASARTDARRPQPPPPPTARQGGAAPAGERTSPQAPPVADPQRGEAARRRAEQRRRAATGASMSARNRIRRMARGGVLPMLVREFFRNTPAWLVSLVFHTVLLILLALYVFRDAGDPDNTIVLSTSISMPREEGAEILPDKDQEVRFDLPVPPEIDMKNPDTKAVIARADQDARELRIDPASTDPTLPPLQRVKNAIAANAGVGSTYAARDPRVRVEIVKHEGGTTLTEAAVARGLRWMAMHQLEDGRWSLHDFRHVAGCNCRGTGATHNDAAATSLVLLPFLGAGQSHLVGNYRDTVSQGLRWLVDHQDPNTGNLGGPSRDNSGVYAHGQATIVLCEAYAMTGDDKLRHAAEKAIEHILNTQHQDGGWRYYGQAMSTPSDTSVVGWQLMALQSARAAGLVVPPERFEMANRFLDRVGSDDGSRYGYTAGQKPTPTMTAEGLLCRMYLGWKNDRPGLRLGTRWLATEENLPHAEQPNIYYWYYATQTMHHYGGPSWEKWNRRMRDVLVSTQDTRGHAAGSWHFASGDHRSGHSSGGRLYTTALAVCTLEVYYRHLPIFKQLDLKADFLDGED
ncbi:Pectic acid lyase [Lignipirellula cremea]|uniref:Pectic acid lyase n=2 Tax=Lignipirellula cremea TaxID=2528010 RepID=A0A518E092_9BACT|nr:Pectic acid lyase [Lignipirellula cremea]